MLLFNVFEVRMFIRQMLTIPSALVLFKKRLTLPVNLFFRIRQEVILVKVYLMGQEELRLRVDSIINNMIIRHFAQKVYLCRTIKP